MHLLFCLLPSLPFTGGPGDVENVTCVHTTSANGRVALGTGGRGWRSCIFPATWALLLLAGRRTTCSQPWPSPVREAAMLSASATSPGSRASARATDSTGRTTLLPRCDLKCQRWTRGGCIPPPVWVKLSQAFSHMVLRQFNFAVYNLTFVKYLDRTRFFFFV